MINMSVDIAGVMLKNPVMTASGTFGSGEEYSEFVDLSRLGAVVTKGVARHWSAESWNGSVLQKRSSIFEKIRYKDSGQCLRKDNGRLL